MMQIPLIFQNYQYTLGHSKLSPKSLKLAKMTLGHFLGFCGILVIFKVLGVFWSFYGFQRYFGHFFMFWRYFGHFLDFGGILVIFRF